jgi:FIMAH domain-containing protein
MKRSTYALLPALALVFSGCGDQTSRTIVAPSLQFATDVASTATPTVVYSNFGPGLAFDQDPAHGWTINGFLGPNIGQQAIAQQFTPAQDARFAGAQVALSLFSGPGSVRLFLQADAAGLPGAVIEEIPIGGLGSAPAVYTASSALHPLLRQGTAYWLSVVAGADAVVAGWSWNSIGDVSLTTFAGTQGGGPAGPWAFNPTPSTRSAFQVNGAPPTPQDGIRVLMGRVADLAADGALREGPAAGLTAKLGAALQSLDRGSVGAACNLLQAFVHQVNALVRATMLAAPIGQELIDAAAALLGEAGCTNE